MDHRAVDDWSQWVDPAEWLMRLDVLLQENAELRGEVARLRADNARMAAAAGLPSGAGHAALPPVPEAVPAVVEGAGGEPPQADASSGTEVKIALFRALFPRMWRSPGPGLARMCGCSSRTGWLR